VTEFRACFARWHLLVRTRDDMNASLARKRLARLLDERQQQLPAWMRAEASDALTAVWGTSRVGQLLPAVSEPPGWLSFVIHNRISTGANGGAAAAQRHRSGATAAAPDAAAAAAADAAAAAEDATADAAAAEAAALALAHTPDSDLARRMGFDVEEVDGWATEWQGGEHSHNDLKVGAELLPLAGRRYLRVSWVDTAQLAANGRRPLHVGDVIMTFFGRGGGPTAPASGASGDGDGDDRDDNRGDDGRVGSGGGGGGGGAAAAAAAGGGGGGGDGRSEAVPALRSREAFTALCRRLPFASLQVYRASEHHTS
jgi:hypothetical protein